MRNNLLSLITLTAMLSVACSSSKKTAATVSTPTPVTTTSTPSVFLAPPAAGVLPPGENELTAIRLQYKETTMEQLKEGHFIYTAGACLSCHRAESIYRYDTITWKNIIEDMAQRAGISETQKDAVYKYVLAMKATQPE